MGHFFCSVLFGFPIRISRSSLLCMLFRSLVFLGNAPQVLYLFLILLPFCLEKDTQCVSLDFQMQIQQLIPVTWTVSKDGTPEIYNHLVFLDLKSFKWIVPCFVPSVLSDLAVKPAETIVSLVLYEENRGKEMISRIIQREDLTSKSLPCYYRGTSKSAYVATQHDNCSTHLFLKSFYM